MQTPGKKSEQPDGSDARRLRWRPWLRALHRDFGYVAVGLTLVYACSGIAVNHIADWDPSFHSYAKTYELGPLQGDDATIAREVEKQLEIDATPRDVFRAAPDRLDLVFDGKRTVHVDPLTGHVVDEGQRPRVLLRIANWLHLNRGKKAWTYVADAYAAALLFLAMSGMFMIAGKRGFFWRGAVFVALGLAIPAVYVVASGGP